MLRCQCPSVCLSVRLSVTEMDWCIIANIGFKFRSKFTAHCGRSLHTAYFQLFVQLFFVNKKKCVIPFLSDIFQCGVKPKQFLQEDSSTPQSPNYATAGAMPT